MRQDKIQMLPFLCSTVLDVLSAQPKKKKYNHQKGREKITIIPQLWWHMFIIIWIVRLQQVVEYDFNIENWIFYMLTKIKFVRHQKITYTVIKFMKTCKSYLKTGKQIKDDQALNKLKDIPCS